ncbi:FG-GAP-like repeat-containing protein [Corallococcus interemptor]|uniref:RHS repeat-associated core domain-containing protein n=1 Tax=Corallococcus TaxID=83461 RepID=UPI0035D4F181
MRQFLQLTRALVSASLLLFSFEGRAQTSASLDARVQAPQLSAPQRGSLTGQLSAVAFGPGDVSRGAYSLASAMTVPTERGAPQASVLPSYSMEAGASEWGTGWQTPLAMTRTRLSGDLDYVSDTLSGPHGRLVQGTDGFWYPEGLSSPVRVAWTGDTLTAFLPDGSKETYGGAARLATSQGTYAWYLTSIEGPTGRRTRIDWTANASGRQFVTAVWYGGLGEDFQYRVDFTYESLGTPFEDYRSGQRVTLDRRVKTVTVLAKNTQTATFEERWHHDLTYQAEGIGPGFYLVGVQQVFRSGEQPPAVTYAYHLASDALKVAPLVQAPKLTAVLSTLGADALQPNKSTLFDSNLDGHPDLEHSTSYLLARQTDTGFTFESLPSPPPGTSSNCRSAPATTNAPRLLARIRSGSGDETPYVVDLRPTASNTQTVFSACTRDGQLQGSHLLTGLWAPGATVKLVDLNRDHQPDLIRIQSGGYRILPNTSTATTFTFGAEQSGVLTPAFVPDSAWVQDFNGDGVADLIARYSAGIVVWYGKGQFRFEPAGRNFPLRTLSGALLTGLSGYSFTFVDANKDGLTDVLLTSTSTNAAFLFMNRASLFQETSVPGLKSVDAVTSKPVVADFSGSGNTEVSYARSGQGYTVALDGAETGLLKSSDDGRGTLLTFGYGRPAAAAGERQRSSVLVSLTVASSGYDTVTYAYNYAEPTLHGRGKFLVGFDSVTRSGPGIQHTARFLNGDTFAGRPSSSAQYDTLHPGLHTYEYQVYEDVQYQGLTWKRLRESGSGWTQDDGQSVGDWQEYSAYEATFCPSVIVSHSHAGTLTTETTRASIPAFSNHLHCLSASTHLLGSHTDTSLDFENEVRIIRNGVGQVTRVEDVSSTGDVLPMQEVSYRSDFLLDHITLPGRGTAFFDWAADGSAQLWRIRSPDGVVIEATARNPLTDALETLTTRRGARAFVQSFRFDGKERLFKQWDNQGNAHEAAPGVALGYRYATTNKPGALTTTTLVDALAGVTSSSVEWQTAAGEPVGRAARIPQGWMVDGITTRSRTLLETRQHLRPLLGAGLDPTALDYATLLTGTDIVGTLSGSGLGFESTALNALQAGVTQQVTTRLSIENGLLKQEAVENGTHATRRFLDAQQHPVAFQDEAGTLYQYDYDALGRLREVGVPDGNNHRVFLDAHGRVERVARDGVAQVAFTYHPDTGLITAKTFFSAQGQPVRREDFSHDAQGRQTQVLHTDLATGTTRSFRFYYDGATPTSGPVADDVGFLTAVEGEGYLKQFTYRADGKPLFKRLKLKDWRTLEQSFAYREDGTVRQEETWVRQDNGTLLSHNVLATHLDPYGRPASIELDGVLLTDLQYSNDGQLGAAQLAGGSWVTFTYDALTRAPRGFSQAAPCLITATSWSTNNRGLLEQENLSVGAQALTRLHGYSAQRFLTSSTDSAHAYAYDYDSSGLPSRIEEDGVSRDQTRQGNTLLAGSNVYTFDASGRTVAKNDLVLSYGPDGHLSQATRGQDTWTYLYDETGHRLLKLRDDVPVAGYIEGGTYLDASGLTQPFRVGERLVGVLRGSTFIPLATDLRGTVLSDEDGTPRFASPYGARATHPSVSAALDFAEKGYDADLGWVRMGVRDYDPDLGRFTTPDPLFLESPGQCVESASECNLYGYARGAPTIYTDPSGQNGLLIGIVLIFTLVPMTDQEWATNAGTMMATVAMPAASTAFYTGKGIKELAEGKYTQAQWSFAGAISVGIVPAVAGRLAAARLAKEAAQAQRAVNSAASAGPPRLTVINGGAGETASASVGAAAPSATGDYIYLATKAKEASNVWGHSAIGVETGGSRLMIHQTAAADIAKANPLIGGYQTTINPLKNAASYRVLKVPVSAEAAAAARVEAQGMLEGASAGPYSLLRNNCVTNCSRVLGAAGIKLPPSVRTPGQLERYLTSQGATTVP